MQAVPEEYFIQKFYQLVPFAKHNKVSNTYQGCCPVCREGRSFGKKKRLIYVCKYSRIYCHNCGLNMSPTDFITRVTGMSYREIIDESQQYDLLPQDLTLTQTISSLTVPEATLPHDSINLSDSIQLNYYRENQIVQKVLEYIRSRRLDTAVNKPTSLWLSLTDFIHKNRLILPFYDTSNEIVFYQSREVFPNELYLPKYLSKVNGDKTLFNLNQVSSSFDKIFIAEGPINCCFVKNGVAVAGIQDESSESLTYKQRSQLTKFFTHEFIWCLDSQWIDGASYKKTQILIENGYNVFIWPEKYGRMFKDFNEMAIKLKLDEIPSSFILKNTYRDLKAKAIISQIKLESKSTNASIPVI